MLTKFAVTAVLLACTVLAAPEAPMKIRLRMKGVKRDASHIANYYLPAAHNYQQQSHYGGLSSAGGHGAQHQQLQVLDVKLPMHGGHYIPSYAIPSKSYESTAHHFPIHTPQFSHNGPQYVIKSSHGGNFEELSQVLGSHGSSANGHVSFGGAASSSGHGIASSAAPSYSYSSQSFGHQAAGLAGHQSAGSSAQGGYTFASIPQTTAQGPSKNGPLSFGEASQSTGHQQQQQQQISAFGGHQFGFVAGGQEQQQHQQQPQQQYQAPQVTYLPQAQALTSSAHISSQGPAQNTPVYAIGMKGLGHYATGNGAASSSASLGHGLSLGQHSFGGLSYGNGGAHGGQYILDTSALKGLNLGGKFVLMSKPAGLSYGQSYSQYSPKYTVPTASYSSASLSSAGGYKTAPFKPSVFLGATQDNVSEYQHGGYGQEATASAGGYSSGGYSSGQEYQYVSPTAASSAYGSSSSGGH